MLAPSLQLGVVMTEVEILQARRKKFASLGEGKSGITPKQGKRLSTSIFMLSFAWLLYTLYTRK